METRLYNLEVLKMTTDGDDEFLMKILATFLMNNKESLAHIQKALTNRNWNEIGVFAHKMLSSYKHLEVHLLIEELTLLESLSFGVEMDKKEVEEMVDYVSFYSEKVFRALEKEIDHIHIGNKKNVSPGS